MTFQLAQRRADVDGDGDVARCRADAGRGSGRIIDEAL